MLRSMAKQNVKKLLVIYPEKYLYCLSVYHYISKRSESNNLRIAMRLGVNV